MGIMTKMTLSLEIRGVSSIYNIDPRSRYISSPQHSEKISAQIAFAIYGGKKKSFFTLKHCLAFLIKPVLTFCSLVNILWMYHNINVFKRH